MSDRALFERLHRRITNLLGRGRIKLIDDTGVIQLMQIDLGPQGAEGPMYLRDKTPVMGLFGHASVPPVGADVLVAHLSGDGQRCAVLGHNHQPSRLRGLGAGDAALYDARGAYVWLKPAGLVIDAAELNVTIQNAANVTVNASTAVTVNAPTVNLGGTGGLAVARVGDTVDLGTGKILTGSTKVKAT
jgi:phage baseplate assembly protein V